MNHQDTKAPRKNKNFASFFNPQERFFNLPWCLGALVVTAFLFLEGCAKHNSNDIVIRCSTWGGPYVEQISQAAATEFEKTHPGVKVRMERTPFGEYVTKLLTQFSANNAPDVMWINADQVSGFATRGVFMDLKPYVDKDPSIRLSDYYPESIRQYTVNGLLTCLPSNIAPTGVVYYNKKEFDEAGIPYPKDDWTYTQFLETAQKLTKKDAKGNTTQFGFLDEWIMWDTWVYDFGGQLVDNERNPTRCILDSPVAIAAVQFRRDLVYKYGVTPGPAYMTAMGNLGNYDFFTSGKVAMFHTGIWHTPTFRQLLHFDWDAVELPKGPQGHRGFVMDAAGYGISKTCKHPDLAYELVRYLSGEVGQKFIASTGLAMPAIVKLAKSKAFLDGQPPKSKAFLTTAVKYGHFASFDPNVAEWTGMVGSELDRVFNNTEAVDVALKKATKEVNKRYFKKP